MIKGNDFVCYDKQFDRWVITLREDVPPNGGYHIEIERLLSMGGIEWWDKHLLDKMWYNGERPNSPFPERCRDSFLRVAETALELYRVSENALVSKLIHHFGSEIAMHDLFELKKINTLIRSKSYNMQIMVYGEDVVFQIENGDGAGFIEEGDFVVAGKDDYDGLDEKSKRILQGHRE